VARARTAWLAFLIAGVAAAVAVPALPDSVRPLVPAAVAGAAVVATAFGVRRNEPISRRAWLLVIAGQFATALLEVFWSSGTPIGYALFAAGLGLLARSRPAPRRGSLVDALIVAGGVSALAWMFVVQPSVTVSGWDRVELGTALGYALFALFLVAVILRLTVFAIGWPATWTLLLAASAVLLLASLFQPASPVPGMLWMVLAGAAALHPSAGGRDGRDSRDAGPVAEAVVSGRRLSPLVLLAALVPAVPLAATSYLVPAAIASLVSVLLVIRLGLVVNAADRRASALRVEAGEREALARELRHSVSHDPLTGLASRAALTGTLDAMIAHRQPGQALCVLLLDLDGFKDVNDTLGHPAGDELLVEVARRLRAVLAGADLVARLGGDEFAAVYLQPPPIAAHAAHTALASLRPAYRIAGREVHLTGSVGFLVLDGQTTSAEVLRDADLALYAAKDAGKNRVIRFTPALWTARLRHSDLIAGLRRALTDGELALHYQPVVRLADGRPVAVEALLRWSPGGEPIPPAQFIPVAEQSGLIVPIGWWALRRACLDARSWYAEHGISVTVNVSGYQLREPDFPGRVLEVLAETGLPPAALVLELTESIVVDGIVGLDRLRAVGVRVAIDDFGTGYSSLSYLARLPVDILKIDRAFVVRAAAGPEWALTRAILDVAASLGLTAIAEGVETEEQAEALRALRCPLAQGFRYSPAVPAAELAVLLAGGGTSTPLRADPRTRPREGSSSGRVR
jgi:diguanylate cyclase (GGDEF)-like protein